MVTILPALRRIREDLAKLLDRPTVERICRELGHHWRKRRLDPYTTLHLFLLQVLHGNTAMTHLPHLSGVRFSAAAYCQARQRLPLSVVQRLSAAVNRRLGGPGADGLWLGHRVALVDGSTFSMPDTPELRAHFGQPPKQRPGCGFPVAHIVALFDAETGFIRDVAVGPLATHDMSQVARLHPQLAPGDVLVGDRGFCSYAHFALLSQANVHAVLRVHQAQIVSFHPHRPSAAEIVGTGIPQSRWLARLGPCDQLVEWIKPRTAPKWMSAAQFAALPDKLVVREIKRRIRTPGCRVGKVTVVTTLLNTARYPAQAIVDLYGVRWQIEVDLRDLKITLGLDVLKGHKVETVLKEMYALVLIYNLVRLVAATAAARQHRSPQRISFIDALRWLQPPKPACPLPILIVNPKRPGRIEPRCQKRRPKKFPFMIHPRQEYRKRLKKPRDAA
jgi:hypothetical protein